MIALMLISQADIKINYYNSSLISILCSVISSVRRTFSWAYTEHLNLIKFNIWNAHSCCISLEVYSSMNTQWKTSKERLNII